MVPMNFEQCRKAKLERPHFFKVQSGKITVCAAATTTYHTSPIHLYVGTTHYLSLVRKNTKHHILSPLPPVVP